MISTGVRPVFLCLPPHLILFMKYSVVRNILFSDFLTGANFPEEFSASVFRTVQSFQPNLKMEAAGIT